MDDYLTEKQLECRLAGTSFSAWICASLNPDVLEEMKAVRQQLRMMMAMWIVSNDGRVHENLAMLAPDELKVGALPGKAIKFHLREEMELAEMVIEDHRFPVAELVPEAASPPLEIVMTDAP